MYLMACDDPPRVTDWLEAIERCRASDCGQSPERNVTLSSHGAVCRGRVGSRSLRPRETRSREAPSALFRTMQTHVWWPVATRTRRSRSLGSAGGGSSSARSSCASSASSSASLLRGTGDERRSVRRAEAVEDSETTRLESVQRYVEQEVARFGWFHGALTREQAARLVISVPLPSNSVSSQPRNGVWLIRFSESLRGQLVLTFAWRGKAKHVRMQLHADGSCFVPPYTSSAYGHITDVLESFATSGLMPADAQPSRAAQPQPFDDFSPSAPAASPDRIVLTRFVANLSRFTDADKLACGILPHDQQRLTTVAPAYICKRLTAADRRSDDAPCLAHVHATASPASRDAASAKSCRAVGNNYTFT